MSSSTKPAALAAILVAAVACAGCNILGPVLVLTQDDRTPAVYKLDSKRSAVIFIDDRNSILPARALRDRIAKSAEKQILDNKLLDLETDGAVRLVASDSLQQVVMAERFSKPRSIAEIGRAVQADQVIYATVDSFTITPDGSQFAPTASLRIKVIDAKNDTRLFPPEGAPGSGGGKEAVYSLAIQEKVRASNLPKTTGEVVKAQQELADEIGRRLGELFYKHSPYSDSKVGR